MVYDFLTNRNAHLWNTKRRLIILFSPHLQINLDPSEFVKEVSGTYGPFSDLPKNNVITSLTLVTNLYSYGPFGQPSGTPFHTRVDKTGSIVGFFGRSGAYLDAIGVYVRPSGS
jgi:hypothetical protein